MTERTTPTSWPLLVLMWLAVIGGLYWAQQLLIPIAFALLLTLLLRPLVRRLRDLGLHEVVSSFGVLLVVAGVFALGMFTIAGQGQKWLAESPGMINRVRDMIPQGKGPLGDLAKATEAVRDLTQAGGSNATPLPVTIQSPEPSFAILGASSHFMAAAVIVFVLAFFFLAFGDPLLEQILSACRTRADQRNLVELVQNVEAGVSRYLATITVINLGLGIATAVVMWFLAVPNPIMWGVLVATLNFVPHVGAFVCMCVLFVAGSVAHESLWRGAGVAGAFALLTAVESYLITPLVLSNSLRLSPLAVILSVLAGGWLWGIAGGLMAAPLLAIIKIVCDQYAPLQFYSAILAGETAAESRPTVSVPIPALASFK